ncbi:MAG: hypothetical protein HYT08_01695 [Candidatus Levybacteria bacterium]|nr:hypothetical protein [Candidatus Levybacteria bacterium]
MDFSAKQSGIFYIERVRAFYYDNSLSSPLKIEFPEDVFIHSEVIDRKKFYVLIHDFLVKNKINYHKVIYIILSPQITFEKDFDKKTVISEAEFAELQDMIPFEEVINKEYRLGNKIKIVNANKHLCNVLFGIFEEGKFLVGGITPLSILKELVSGLDKNLNLDLLIGKTELLRSYSLFDVEDPSAANQSRKKNALNIRYIILLGILGSLIILLTALLLLR